MTDLKSNTQEAFDRLEDIDETWAHALMDECEQQMRSTDDDQEIHVEPAQQTIYSSNIPQAEQISMPVNQNISEFNFDSETTAIQRQIYLKAQQVKSEPSNAEKAVQGFWSFLKRNKAVS